MKEEKNSSLAISERDKMLDMLEIVRARLLEIKDITTTSMKTSGQFRWSEEYKEYVTNTNSIDIHKISKVEPLLAILGSIIQREQNYIIGAKKLGFLVHPIYKYLGYSTEEWINDIKIRISVLTCHEEKEKLTRIEKELSTFMTEEDRLKSTLISVAKELNL